MKIKVRVIIIGLRLRFYDYAISKRNISINSRKIHRRIMQKNDIGKLGGVSGAVALVVVIICQLFHSGGTP